MSVTRNAPVNGKLVAEYSDLKKNDMSQKVIEKKSS